MLQENQRRKGWRPIPPESVADIAELLSPAFIKKPALPLKGKAGTTSS